LNNITKKKKINIWSDGDNIRVTYTLPQKYKTSVDFTCGSEKYKCPKGYCCSNYGYCGKTDDYCNASNGCQIKYGDCYSSKNYCGEGLGRCMDGFCCSKYGHCGTTDEHCSVSNGCQSEFGICKNQQQKQKSSTSSSSQCGYGIGICPSGYCCSKYGYCGKTDEYCSSSNGCQVSYGICT